MTLVGEEAASYLWLRLNKPPILMHSTSKHSRVFRKPKTSLVTAHSIPLAATLDRCLGYLLCDQMLHRTSSREESCIWAHGLKTYSLEWPALIGRACGVDYYISMDQKTEVRAETRPGCPHCGVPTVACVCQPGPMSYSFHNLPKQHRQLGTKCSDTWACGGHFPSKL